MKKTSALREIPCRVGIVGTGYIGRGLADFLPTTTDLKISKILTRRRISSCKDFPLKKKLTNSLKELIDNSDIIIECSGHVIHAADVVQEAFKAKLPVVTLNSEFHVTCGSYFVSKGVLTEGHGDQPGTLAALNENALAMGFKPLVYGNIKGFYNPTPMQKSMAFWSKKQKISLPMVTASTDGTKLQVEQALLGNGLGSSILCEGMTGYPVADLNELNLIGERLAKKAKKMKKKVADYIISQHLPLRVFIVAEHDKRQRHALTYLKFGNGPFYIIHEHIMLCHLELAKTIRRIVKGGPILLNNGSMPHLGVAAVAKHKLKKGEKIIHGLGSFQVRGVAVKLKERKNHIPIGLLYDAIITKNVDEGHVLTFSDVDIPQTLALKAYKSIK